MPYRLKFSARALREANEAQEWYEAQKTGLGEEFLNAIELQLKQLVLTPLIHTEVLPKVRRAVLTRFPYGLFFTIQGELIHVLAVLHDARNPRRWPKVRQK